MSSARLRTARDIVEDDESLFVGISHAETMQDVFPQWLRLAYRGGGEEYTPYDMNMPPTIPKRPLAHFEHDPPITEHGKISAELIGKSLQLADIKPNAVFSSPELRCVQTAAALLRAMGQEAVGISVEPSLSGWRLAVPDDAHKQWLTPQQLNYLGLPINLNYAPHINVDSLRNHESAPDYLRRIIDFYAATSAGETMNAVVVCNIEAIHVLENEGWVSPAALKVMSKSKLGCILKAIKITADRRAEPLHNFAQPFTRTLKQAIEEEKQRKK